jgi:tRNA (cytidine56-2'-O)-methyltransferase
MAFAEVTVLRLGHRPGRDKRITTHCGLVARALGAKKMVISGDEDDELVARLGGLGKKWGGKFSCEYRKDWRKAIKEFKGVKVHLTMYGEDFRKVIGKTRDAKNKAKPKPLLLVVGAGKVPREVYGLCDYNAAVGNQPHSEVAAIALFLYELNGRKLGSGFSGGAVAIVPQAHGKKVVKRGGKK